MVHVFLEFYFALGYLFRGIFYSEENPASKYPSRRAVTTSKADVASKIPDKSNSLEHLPFPEFYAVWKSSREQREQSSRRVRWKIDLVRTFFSVDERRLAFVERDSRGRRATGIFVGGHFLGDLHSVKTSLSAKWRASVAVCLHHKVGRARSNGRVILGAVK